jgi:hypothetical protein
VSALHPNFPNPFNPSTEISFEVPSGREVTITVYDAMGREVATLVRGWHEAGSYRAKWDASGFASGVYLCRMMAGDYLLTRKLMLTK